MNPELFDVFIQFKTKPDAQNMFRSYLFEGSSMDEVEQDLTGPQIKLLEQLRIGQEIMLKCKHFNLQVERLCGFCGCSNRDRWQYKASMLPPMPMTQKVDFYPGRKICTRCKN